MTLSKFRAIANRFVVSNTGMSLDDLPDAVDPLDYYDELADDDEAIIAAEEYAYAVIEDAGG